MTLHELRALYATWHGHEDGASAVHEYVTALEAEVERLQARERELQADPRLAVSSEDMWRVAANAARVRKLEAALHEIRDQEWTENVLDPQWAARIAQAALAAVSAETPAHDEWRPGAPPTGDGRTYLVRTKIGIAYSARYRSGDPYSQEPQPREVAWRSECCGRFTTPVAWKPWGRTDAEGG